MFETPGLEVKHELRTFQTNGVPDPIMGTLHDVDEVAEGHIVLQVTREVRDFAVDSVRHGPENEVSQLGCRIPFTGESFK